MPETNTADIAPAYTYQWADAEQTTLQRTDADGNVAWVPTDPRNNDYSEFLSSGAEAALYVGPPEPEPAPEKTTEEKVDRLLEDYGLSREEMRAALAVKTE